LRGDEVDLVGEEEEMEDKDEEVEG